MNNGSEQVRQIRCRDIFLTFFRIGMFTFGGGLAMSAVVRHELVINRRWIKDEDFMTELSTATLIPGAIAVNLAYTQGRRLRGLAGAAAALAGTILPSFMIILAIALFAKPYFSNPRVTAFLKGCAVGVSGQLAFAAIVFGRKYLCCWRNFLVCALGIGLIMVFQIHPVLMVLAAGLAGVFLCANPTGGDCSQCINRRQQTGQQKQTGQINSADPEFLSRDFEFHEDSK